MRRLDAPVLACLTLVLAAATASPAMASNVYVTNVDGRTISQFDVATSGLLGPLKPPAIPVDTENHVVRNLAVSPDGKSLYGTSTSDQQGTTARIVQFDIARDGDLTPKSPSFVGPPIDDATPKVDFLDGVGVSPDGDNLYATSCCDARVFQFDIESGGRLTPKATAAVPLNGTADAVAATGKYVYVADHDSFRISQFVRSSRGGLKPLSPATVPAGSGAGGFDAGPQQIVASPDGTSVYVSESGDGTILQYDIAPEGTLKPKSPAAVPTPDPLAAYIAISPDGENVYSLSTVSTNISQFAVGSGGRLSEVPREPAPSVPGELNGIAVSAGGRSVYVSDYEGNRVAQFAVGARGQLSPRSPLVVPVGIGPQGIVARATPLSAARAPENPTVTTLIAALQTRDLHEQTESQLMNPLNRAQAHLDQKRSFKARKRVTEFVAKVREQRGKRVAADSARVLIRHARATRSALRCAERGRVNAPADPYAPRSRQSSVAGTRQLTARCARNRSHGQPVARPALIAGSQK